ncbi:related to RNA and export factor binding protein [Phialocephala subalpina]|uniref:Related to RNA and export factor binding protein n=1 Tax=Phialocephala subalpina TaxID=576137 RepID=A0A1L7WEQ1_9HELO|nr:related to RNA and export factor binding protein [Phialocephala subalpina]
MRLLPNDTYRGGGRGPRGPGRRGGRRNERTEYPRDGVRKVAIPSLFCVSFVLGENWANTFCDRCIHLLLNPHPHIYTAFRHLLRLSSPAMLASRNIPRLMASRGGAESNSIRDDSRNIDSEWVHDKFDDNTTRRPVRNDRRYSPETYEPTSAKLRVENLHYDLTEDDLDDLFNRIGPVLKLSLTYDRAGRSEGVAYVTYESAADAKQAIREFDGANAKGQPIRLTSVPAGPSGRRAPPPVSRGTLFDRITPRTRSESPIRHSDVSGPPPTNVDRYVPGRGSRSRSPRPRGGRGDSRRDGRRPGARRERGDRNGGGRGGERLARDGRPRKTQEELDAEMDDYFGGGKSNGDTNGASEVKENKVDDVDMEEIL